MKDAKNNLVIVIFLWILGVCW